MLRSQEQGRWRKCILILHLPQSMNIHCDPLQLACNRYVLFIAFINVVGQRYLSTFVCNGFVLIPAFIYVIGIYYIMNYDISLSCFSFQNVCKTKEDQ